MTTLALYFLLFAAEALIAGRPRTRPLFLLFAHEPHRWTAEDTAVASPRLYFLLFAA